MQVACKRRPHALVYDRYWRKADSVIAMEMEAHEAPEDGGCLGEESCGDPMPMYREKGILYAIIDPETARSARKSLDVAGHYNRPDLFRLEVHRRTATPAIFVDDP